MESKRVFQDLKDVSNQIIEKLRYDEKSTPDLLDQFRVRDAQSHKYFTEPYKSVWGSVVEHTDFLSMPQFIIDDCINRDSFNGMGLLPEINRAWITVDNKLYIWNYANPADFNFYDELSEVIVSVALSAPKPGIFGPAIKYVLAVATPVEIVLLAISIDDQLNKLKIARTLFSIPSDSVVMFKMIGSQMGRIFMAGNDGNLYEMEYTNEESTWNQMVGFVTGDAPSLKCQKINHFSWKFKLLNYVPPFVRALTGSEDAPLTDLVIDDVRQVLYTLTGSGVGGGVLGAVSVENRMHFFVESFNIIEKAHAFCLTMPDNSPHGGPSSGSFRDANTPGNGVRGLYPIRPTESKYVHLLIVLKNGIRIYLSLTNYYGSYTGIEIKHIRSPPSQSCLDIVRMPFDPSHPQEHKPNYSVSHPLNVVSSLYSHGVTLMALETNPNASNQDELWGISPDIVSNRTTDQFHQGAMGLCLREGISRLLPRDQHPNVGNVYDIQEWCGQIHSPAASRLMALYFGSSTPATNKGVTNYTQPVNIAAKTSLEGDKCSPIPVIYSSAIAPANPKMEFENDTSPKGYGSDLNGSIKIENLALLGELTTQGMPSGDISLRRKFLTLTDRGVHVYEKLRPVDVLYKTIFSSSVDNDQLLNYFVDNFGELEFCAMNIALSCGLPCDVPSGMGGAFLQPGSGARRNESLEDMQMHAMSIMRKFNYHQPREDKRRQPTQAFPQGAKDNRLVIFSAGTQTHIKSFLHDGIMLALSRILRPIWLRVVFSSKKELMSSFKSLTLIRQIRTPLQQLQKLLKNYYSLAVLSNDPEPNATGAGEHDLITDQMRQQSQLNVNEELKRRKEAERREEASIRRIYRLVSRCIQALSFIEIILSVQEDWPKMIVLWEGLSDFSFERLVIDETSHQAVKKIIHGLIVAITTVSEKKHLADEKIAMLSKTCYHFFSPGDRLNYEATKSLDECRLEIKMNGGWEGLNNTKIKSMHSVELILKCSKYWKTLDTVFSREGTDELNKYCKSMLDLGPVGYSGVVDLCISVADNFRPRDHARPLALTQFRPMEGEDGQGKDDMVPHDIRLYHGGKEITPKEQEEAIQACNTCLVNQILRVGQSTGLSNVGQNQPAAESQERVAIGKADSAMKSMIDKAVKDSHDSELHDLLYAQLQEQGYQDVMLSIKTVYAEDYLDRTDHKLLYSYYERHGEHLKASVLMANMAKTDNNLHINRRIEYLSKAIASADRVSVNSVGNALTVYNAGGGGLGDATNRHFVVDNIKHYKDLMDVAVLQERAYNLLGEKENLDQLMSSTQRGEYADNQESIKAQIHELKLDFDRLENKLIPIIELFNDIVIKRRLWDVALMLLNTANIDALEHIEWVARLWRSIIYRIVPRTGRTPESTDFLYLKRRSEYIETYDRYQENQGINFEDVMNWLPYLITKIKSLGGELNSSADANPQSFTVPAEVIIEELEDILSTVVEVDRTGEIQGRYLGVSADCCIDIGISHGALVEAYMKVLDNWHGKKASMTILQVMRSTTKVLKEWTKLADDGNMANTSGARDLRQAILSHQFSRWLEKIRSRRETLALDSITLNTPLLEDIKKDYLYLEKRVEYLYFSYQGKMPQP